MAYGRSYAASRGGYARARGGFLSKLAKGALGVATAAFRATPVGQAVTVAQGLVRRSSMPTLTLPGGLNLGPAQGTPRPGVTGTMQRLLPGGESGYIKARRMNAGNAKAARRSIRRIKAVRKLLQSIERELPRRPAIRSGGVITRAEAMRALKS